MKKILQKIEHFNYAIAAVVIVGIALGVTISLSLRSIKYTEHITPPISGIDAKVAYQNMLDNPSKYIFIDVRSEGEYNKAHAKGSVNLPIHYLYDDTHGLKNEKGIPLPINNDQEIYLTCTGGRLAGVAYSYLEHYGYRNIKRINNGLAGWSDAGLPIVSPDIFESIKTRNVNQIDDQAPLDRPYELKK